MRCQQHILLPVKDEFDAFYAKIIFVTKTQRFLQFK